LANPVAAHAWLPGRAARFIAFECVARRGSARRWFASRFNCKHEEAINMEAEGKIEERLARRRKGAPGAPIDLGEDELIDTAALAKIRGESVSKLTKERLEGGGPVYVKLGRTVRYRLGDVRTWLQSQRVRSTSEATVQDKEAAR
jgi:hypothetical protein